MIGRARADEVSWVAATISLSPWASMAPGCADHEALVAAGEAHVLEEAGERLGPIVQRAADRLSIDILALLPAAQRALLGPCRI